MQHSANAVRIFLPSPSSILLVLGIKLKYVLVCKCERLLEDILRVAVYNHQPVPQRKPFINIWVFPSQSGWIEATLKRSHDSVMMKKIELGQVNENSFP